MVIAVTSAIWTRDTLVEEKRVMSDKYDGPDGSSALTPGPLWYCLYLIFRIHLVMDRNQAFAFRN